MNLKTRRMNHIFKEDGKALIVAMDHGTFNGAAPGLEHPGETLQQIAEVVEQMQYFVTLVWQENLQKNWHH